jgi:hypothetical protein
MRKILLLVFIALFLGLFSACSSSNTDAAGKAVEEYLNVLVTKDENRLPSLVCGDWESDALMQLDSLQAVTARLEDVSCKQSGSDGSTALVNCTGKLVTTYNNEDSNIDLSTETYQVVQQGGDWLVCGTR